MSMRRFLAVPVLLALAACSATGSSTTPAAATPSSAAASASASTSASASASASGGGAGEIEAEDSDLGTILVDAQGNTIYFFDNDEKGVSNCSGDCQANWPPVVADATPDAGSGVTAKLGTFMRDDGTSQLTVNGFPAYHFAGDQSAGDTNGQAVGGIWWVFGADGDPIKN